MSTRGKRSERGASAVEYGLFVAGVAAAIIMPLQAIGLSFAAYGDKCVEDGMNYQEMSHAQSAACGFEKP